MSRSADATAREAKIEALKRLITAGNYDTLEKLEDAVDELLWSEHDRLQEARDENLQQLVRSHPK